MRGYEVIQFNLIEPMKTSVYNPLLLAADAAREGNKTKCAMYVTNVAEVFFPVEGGEDPVWANSANNAFKRAVYGLIDFYLEEEKELINKSLKENMDSKVLSAKIDQLWGAVSLYNTYQMFVQLTSKKKRNPLAEFEAEMKNAARDKASGEVISGKYKGYSNEEINQIREDKKREATLWDGKPEVDLLTLYFNATDKLPKNSIRTLVADANNSLKAIGGAEKMLSSIYGIALTAMVRVVYIVNSNVRLNFNRSNILIA